MMDPILIALVISLGLNGFLFGLWFGERGRRRDAQWVAKIERYAPQASVVSRPSAESRAAEPVVMPVRTSRDIMIQHALEEGLSLEQAKLYADEIEQGMAAQGLGGAL